MLKVLFCSFFLLLLNLHATLLQETINKAPAGSTIKLSSGTYSGNIIINKPLTLLGQGENSLIKGEGRGNVVTIQSSSVTLKNIKVIDSGDRLENLDSAIFIKDAKNVKIENIIIERVLFGIFMDGVSDSVVIKNTITSNAKSVGLRGDSIRLWFSHNNLIKNNLIKKSRDIAIMRSNNNTIETNQIEDSRYAIYTYHAKNSKIKNNTVKESAVGIFIQASLDTKVSNNTIKGAQEV